MKEIKKILCAVDLSGQSRAVAEYAVCLAKATGATVAVLHVAPSLDQQYEQYECFDVPPSDVLAFMGKFVAGAEKTMTGFMAAHFAGIEATGQVIVGIPAEKILQYADAENADLIVMGTHGRQGIDRILFGSVAENVVKNARQPVLTIRPVN